MKFTLLKLSAFALVATTAVASKHTALRGPAVAVSDVATDSAKVSDARLPEFFPSGLTEDQIAVRQNNGKKTASQKRQEKRDARRDIDNPNRSQEEENKERARKTGQSRSRKNGADVDPYADNDNDFGRNREAKRAFNCERNGSGCNYSGPNQQCYDDCVADGAFTDRVCARKCEYLDVDCNEDCRDDGGSIERCLDRCQKNIDGLDGDYYYYDFDGNGDRNGNRSGRNNRGADIDCIEDCRDDFPNRDSNRYRNCIDECDLDNPFDNDSNRGNRSGRGGRNTCVDECEADFPNTDGNKYRKCVDRCP